MIAVWQIGHCDGWPVDGNGVAETVAATDVAVEIFALHRGHEKERSGACSGKRSLAPHEQVMMVVTN